MAYSDRTYVGTGPGPEWVNTCSGSFMAYSDRTYVGTGPGPEWVTVYYVKPSHCNLCGNLNGSYTLALYQSQSHISPVRFNHHIAGDGLWYGLGFGFLSCTEIGSRDLSPSLCNMKCSTQYNVAIRFGIRIRVHTVNLNDP